MGYVDRLVELGILSPETGSLFSDGDVRRVRLVHGLEEGGLPLEGLAIAVRNGDFPFGFLDLPAWDWFGGLVGKTYRELSAESGLSLELLQAIRESMGFARPGPDDPVHQDELDLIPVVRVVLEAGVDPSMSGWSVCGAKACDASPKQPRTSTTPRSRSRCFGRG